MRNVLIYGSLLNPASAERALQRAVKREEMRTARLPGYRLAWTSIHQVRVEPDNRLVPAAFLNLEPAANEVAIGQIIAVSETEFERLRRREKGYSVREVACVDEAGMTLSAWTFIDERPSAVPGTVMQAYVDKVRAGALGLGPDFARAYLGALPVPVQPVTAGAYRFVDVDQRYLT